MSKEGGGGEKGGVGGGCGRSGGGLLPPPQLELCELTRKLSLGDRRKAGKSGGGSSPSSSSDKEETLPFRRYEGRKKGTRGSLSSEADVSSLSTDGEVDLSSSSPTSFSSDRFNAAGSKVKTSTPKEKVVGGGGMGDGGGPSGGSLEHSSESGYGGGDEEGGGSDWFGLASPKFGTPVPNRIFIGGISCQTTENDLVRVFAKFGNVRGAKIIFDRGGVSKGYGFVTFETEQEAAALCDSIVKKQFEPIILRDRRLNIAPAIKKQPGFSTDSGFSADGSGLGGAGGGGGGMGYFYQNPYPLPAQTQPLPPMQTQYYDYAAQAEGAGGNAYLDHYAYAAALASQPPHHQLSYAPPQHYYAPPPQAQPPICYYDPAQHYQLQMAAAAQWNEWASAAGAAAVGGIGATPHGVYYQEQQYWDAVGGGHGCGISVSAPPPHYQ